MEPMYKEAAVKTPTAAKLTEIASQLGFDLGPAEIQEYTGMDYLFLTNGYTMHLRQNYDFHQ